MADNAKMPEPARGINLGKRRELDYLWAQLDSEFSSFRTHYRDLADNILPRRLRFNLSDAGKGEAKNTKIIDGTATMAARTLAAGMMSGITSPARKWFLLTIPNKDLKEFGPVKTWLHQVTELMNSVFLKSNIYKVFPIMYKDMGSFATHAMSIEEDHEQVIRFYPFPLGSYRLGVDSKLRVRVFMREFRYTVYQAIDRFGRIRGSQDIDWSKFSQKVKDCWERGDYNSPVDIRHCVRENPKYDPKKKHMAIFKKYSSDYFEIGHGNSNEDQNNGPVDGIFLRESGFDYFPILAPRWEVVGEDAYGTDCPGMTALGDIKEAHLLRKRRSQAIEYQIRPPMRASSSLKTASPSILPGDITYHDEPDMKKAFEPVYRINPDIGAITQEMQEIRRIISRSYYEDLFLMLAQSDRREITAREIDERKEEKLLALGPVLEQLNQDVLDPLIQITFEIMKKQRLIPRPPRELSGQPLKVEYISMMHQAQKLVGLAGHERFLTTLSTVQALDPNAIHKFDADQYIDEYSDILTIPPGVIRSDDDVATIRQEIARRAQQQAELEQAQAAASAAKDLSSAKLDEDNALSRLAGGA